MKVVVVGSGAVGAYFGAALVKAGQTVTFVARGEHARALRTRGLVVHLDDGQPQRFDTRDVCELQDAHGADADLVLVAVKATALAQVAPSLPQLVAGDGLVAPLINGVESEQQVAGWVGQARTVAALAYISSGLTAPGEMRVHGQARIGFAGYDAGQLAKLHGVAEAFQAAGVGASVRDDPVQMLWEKMVWNAAFNGICALTDRTAGDVAQHCEGLLRAAMGEVIQVGRAEGAKLTDGMVDKLLEMTRTQFEHTEPSMLQDVRAGRPTEVDTLQAVVVRRGRQHGIGTPVMETLEALLRARSGSAGSTPGFRNATG